MNLIQLSDDLKGLSDQQLATELNQPTGVVPSFLVMSELKRRKDARAMAQSGPPDDGKSLAEEYTQQAMAPPPGASYGQQRLQGQVPQLGGPSAHPPGMVNAAPPMSQPGPQQPAPQGFANGGEVMAKAMGFVPPPAIGQGPLVPKGGMNGRDPGSLLPGLTRVVAQDALTQPDPNAVPMAMAPAAPVGMPMMIMAPGSAGGATGSGGDSTGGVSGTGGVGGSASDAAGGSAAAGVGGAGSDGGVGGVGGSDSDGGTYAKGGIVGFSKIPPVNGQVMPTEKGAWKGKFNYADGGPVSGADVLAQKQREWLASMYASPDNSIPDNSKGVKRIVQMSPFPESPTDMMQRITGSRAYQNSIAPEGALPPVNDVQAGRGYYNEIEQGNPGQMPPPTNHPTFGSMSPGTADMQSIPKGWTDGLMPSGPMMGPATEFDIPTYGDKKRPNLSVSGGIAGSGLGAVAPGEPDYRGMPGESAPSMNGMPEPTRVPPNPSAPGGDGLPSTEKIRGRGTGGITGSSESGGSLADRLAEVKALQGPDRFAALEQSVKDQQASKGDHEENKWMSLAKAGFAMAAGNSPYALQNIGAGANVGIDSYQREEDRLRDAKQRLLQSEIAIAAARDSGDKNDLKTAFEGREHALNRVNHLEAAQITASAHQASIGESAKTREASVMVRMLHEIETKDSKLAQEYGQLGNGMNMSGAPLSPDEVKAGREGVQRQREALQQQADEITKRLGGQMGVPMTSSAMPSAGAVPAPPPGFQRR